MHGTSWELEKVRGNAVMAMLTLAIISVVASLQVFGKDRLVFWRESESGDDAAPWQRAGHKLRALPPCTCPPLCKSALPCPALPCPALPGLPCPKLFCLAQPGPALPCPVCPALSCSAWPSLALPCLPCPNLFCLAHPGPALPCLALQLRLDGV